MAGAAGRTRALTALLEAGVPHTVHEYVHDPDAQSFGAEAAQQLGTSSDRIFKTLMVRLGDGEFVIAVIPVTHHLSLKAVAKAAGSKRAEMADPKVAQQRTGYVLGGISPLGQTTPHRVFLDEGALEGDTFIVSAGQRGLSVEAPTLELAEAMGAVWAPLRTQQ